MTQVGDKSLYIGAPVLIQTVRPHKEQWNGAVGQVVQINDDDVAKVIIGRASVHFYSYELSAIGEGGK